VNEGGGGMANGPAESEIRITKRPLSLYTVAIFYSSSCIGSLIFILLDSYLAITNTRLQNLLNSLGERGGKIRGV
jgi:hypothetical protein